MKFPLNSSKRRSIFKNLKLQGKFITKTKIKAKDKADLLRKLGHLKLFTNKR